MPLGLKIFTFGGIVVGCGVIAFFSWQLWREKKR